MYPSLVTHLPEDGHMSSRTLYEVYCVYNIFSYTYVYLLVLATISDCSVHGDGSFKINLGYNINYAFSCLEIKNKNSRYRNDYVS
jgi:hypothetical protein